MDEILEGLNEAQRAAVSSPADVLQVLAPPGSGKTKTLTARVAYLIKHRKFQPWNIVVCTFTIKAAREMQDRLKNFIGEQLERKLVLGTFHSVARRYLATYGHLIGIEKNFGIADSADTLAKIKRIIKRNNFEADPSRTRSRISKVKARSTNLSKQDAQEKQEFDTILDDYTEDLRANNLLDYDDLLLRCVELLRLHPVCVSNVQTILIDEFQDTNHVQYELMSLFAQKRGRITIVGDPDQSIYAFRSAEVKNVQRMQRQYPSTHVVNLEENYRSAGSILQSAIEVIEQDDSRPAKRVLPTLAIGEQPVLRKLPHPKAEATWLMEEIIRVHTLTGGLLDYNDFAILLRSSAQSHAIELALGNAGVPYRMVGGHKFFDRMEIKLVINYMRVVSFPNHNDAVINVLNSPSRGIGEALIKHLTEEAEKSRVPLWQLVLDIAQGRAKQTFNIAAKAQKGLEAFVGVILGARQRLLRAVRRTAIEELLDFLVQRLTLESYLKKKYAADYETRWENIEQLRQQASHFCASRDIEISEPDLVLLEGVEQRRSDGAQATLSEFLANVALATDMTTNDEVDSRGQVTISTMHAAKGLEWPVVFIASVYDGSIPHSRADDHDEERRLLYVAMTRAQALLYLSCPCKGSPGSSSSLLSASSFVSPRSVSRLLSLKGPSFSVTTVQDLSGILRRRSPPVESILAAQHTVDRLEDDYWPLDGEDVEVAESDSWIPAAGTLAKRRKLVHGELGSAPSMIVQACGTAISKVDLLNSPSGSVVAVKRGFVSASTRMIELQMLECGDAKQQEATAPTKQPPKVSSAKKRTSGKQGGLMGFLRPLGQGPPDAVATWQTAPNRHPGNTTLAISAQPKGVSFMPVTVNVSTTEICQGLSSAVKDAPQYSGNENASTTMRPQCQGLADKAWRPASSFHIARHDVSPNSGLRATKRVLGVRRYAQGWSQSSARKPFVTPSRVKYGDKGVEHIDIHLPTT